MNTILTINVVESNGQVDEAATRASFFAKLEELKADRSSHTEDIARAVSAVFDRYEPGSRINLPHLTAQTITAMNVPPKAYGKWEVRVLDYVRSNSKGNGSLFDIGKGAKNGGVARNVRPASSSETGSASTEVAASPEMAAAAE